MTDLQAILFALYTLAGMFVTVWRQAGQDASDAEWMLYTLYIIFCWPVALLRRRVD